MKKETKRKLFKIKKGIIVTLLVIAFIILVSEPITITISNIIVKIICLFYIWIVAKANNYFYQGERR